MPSKVRTIFYSRLSNIFTCWSYPPAANILPSLGHTSIQKMSSKRYECQIRQQESSKYTSSKNKINHLAGDEEEMNFEENSIDPQARFGSYWCHRRLPWILRPSRNLDIPIVTPACTPEFLAYLVFDSSTWSIIAYNQHCMIEVSSTATWYDSTLVELKWLLTTLNSNPNGSEVHSALQHIWLILWDFKITRILECNFGRRLFICVDNFRKFLQS